MQPQQTPPNELPKQFAKARNIHGIVGSLFVLIIFLGMSWMIYNRTGRTDVALLVAGVGIVASIIGLSIALLSNRQLTAAAQNPQTYTHLESGTAAEYKSAAPEATLSTDEQVISWVGPVTRTDSGATSYTIISKEVNNDGENTLVFTNRSIIGLMVGPDDVSNIELGGLQKAAGGLLDASPDSTNTKGQQFRALYANKWPEIMQNLLAKPLKDTLLNHLNFGVPYAQIKSVKVNNGFINSGITIFLSDGSKITYSTFNKDRLDEIAGALSQYTTVER